MREVIDFHKKWLLNLKGANLESANLTGAVTIGTNGLSPEQKAKTINTTD